MLAGPVRERDLGVPAREGGNEWDQYQESVPAGVQNRLGEKGGQPHFGVVNYPTLLALTCSLMARFPCSLTHFHGARLYSSVRTESAVSEHVDSE